jgi:integrase
MGKFVQEQICIDPDARIYLIKTTASDNWYVQYNEPGRGKGRQRRKSLKTTNVKHARKLAARFANQFIAGQVPHRRSRLTSFGEVVHQRLDRLHQTRTKETVKVYAGHYRALAAALPQGDKTPLVSLSTALLEKVEKALREGGVPMPSAKGGPARKAQPRKPKGVREVMKACRGLIKFALARELIDRDPAAAYVLPRGASDEIVIFSASELGQIFDDPRPQMADTWRFMTYCALRIDEFCWLTKTDIVRDERGEPVSALIRKKVLPETQERWTPKAGHERVIPLTAQAKAIVTGKVAESITPWLFEAPANAKGLVGKWTPDRLRDHLKVCLKASGINHGSPHVLRHTFASFLAKTMPLPVLQRFLGHNDIQTTMKYVHVDARDIAAALGTCDIGRLTETLDANKASTTAASHISNTTGAASETKSDESKPDAGTSNDPGLARPAA